MSDRRLFRSNGVVAHTSLRGTLSDVRFTDGTRFHVAATTAPILDAPQGSRDRELITGDDFVVLDDTGDFVFGFACKDGYVGYIDRTLLRTACDATHVVSVPRSYAKATPGVKSTSPIKHLSFGARLEVVNSEGGWSETMGLGQDGGNGFVPSVHLAPIGDDTRDVIAVAEQFIGTPYLWGGNSSFGIDCSGLVQAACLACGIPCPGDSDMQQASLGQTLPKGAALQRGDLMFWKGHVAWVVDAHTILHANAHHMAVVFEPLDQAVARIAAQGDGRVTLCKRLERSDDR